MHLDLVIVQHLIVIQSGSLVSGFQTAVTAKKRAVKVAATSGTQTISDVKALMENGVILGRPHDEELYGKRRRNNSRKR